MKDEAEVIREFNELVNMTASDLESWLKSGDSRSAGWPKSDGSGDRETVGHDSGRKIVEILKANPKKNPDDYTDEQVAHMRKVVAYCKRHLAQESAGNEKKSAEELRETKSYASLKNWGHDVLKARGEVDSESNDVAPSKKKEQNGKKQAAKGTRGASKQDGAEGNGNEEEADEENGSEAEVDGGAEDDDESGGEDEDENEDAEEDEDQSEGEDDAKEKKPKKNVGKKRKQASGADGASKRRKTRKGVATRPTKQSADENGDDDGDKDGEESVDDEEETNSGQGKEPTKGPSKGDTVSWNWGGVQPEGKVLDVRGEKTTITTKRGNEVSRNGKPDDPAVVLDAGSSKAIKLAHELN